MKVKHIYLYLRYSVFIQYVPLVLMSILCCLALLACGPSVKVTREARKDGSIA